MRSSTAISLVLSVALAAFAVFGVRAFLRDQASANLQPAQTAPQNTIVMAAQPLRFGKVIEPSSLKVIDWPSDSIPEGAFRTIAELMGETGEARYVMTAIETGEPILNSKVTGPGQRATLSSALTAGMKAVSIRVNDVLGVAGFVLPGDRVDILWTRKSEDRSTREQRVFTDVLLQGVKVLAIDQVADDRADQPSVVKTVTFEVSTTEAQKLTLGATVGSLSLTLRNIASSAVENVSPVNISDLGGGAAAQALRTEQIESQRSESIANVERLVRKVGGNSDKRVETLKKEIDERADKELAGVRTATTTAPNLPAVRTERRKVRTVTSIGVYRNSKKTEYDVKETEREYIVKETETE